MKDIEYYQQILNQRQPVVLEGSDALEEYRLKSREVFAETQKRLKEAKKDLCFKCEIKKGQYVFERRGHGLNICADCYDSILPYKLDRNYPDL